VKAHCAVSLLTSGSLLLMTLSIAEPASMRRDTEAPTDSRLDMVAALQAVDPHPSLGEQARVFGRLVGTWIGEYIEFSRDGRAAHSSGEWIFGWVLDGRAMQDVVIIYPLRLQR
jgi:hypothetical protein